MLVVTVQVHVKPEFVVSFREATEVNALASVKEPGIARFDVLQQGSDPTRFLLIEAYRTDDAPAAHKLTSHYLAWRDAVAPMMAEPRQSISYVNCHPPDSDG